LKWSNLFHGRFGVGLGVGLGLGLGLGEGFGLSVGLGLAVGDGLSVGLGLAVGDGLSLGLGLGLGLGRGRGVWVGTGSIAGLSGVVGLGAVAAGLVEDDRDLRFFEVGGDVTSVGAGPTSAGLATSTPVGCDSLTARPLRLAVRTGVKEQTCELPGTDERVNLSPTLRPRSETIVGVVVWAFGSPSCNATAV
jgi:hypothetical protein